LKTRRIVITGGPGSGKTTLISYLEKKGYGCLHEISRSVTIDAKNEGVEQIFLENPLLFSERLLEGRLQQFRDGLNLKLPYLFYDRGLPDISAYMDFIKFDYPVKFSEVINTNRYDVIFLLPPWEAIYKQDNERYETFDQAESIYYYLLKSYQKYNYNVIEVPTGTIQDRALYMINYLNRLY